MKLHEVLTTGKHFKTTTGVFVYSGLAGCKTAAGVTAVCLRRACDDEPIGLFPEDFESDVWDVVETPVPITATQFWNAYAVTRLSLNQALGAEYTHISLCAEMARQLGLAKA